MIKRVLFSLALMLTVFSCISFANISQYRLKFTVNSPFLLAKNMQYAVPAGEYWVYDMGTAPGHLLALQDEDRRHVGFLTTVRINRAVQSWRDEARAVFDLESETQLPVLKQLYIPGTDGYEILSAKLDKKAKGLIDVATISRGKATITYTPIEGPAAEPEAAPVTEPAPTPEVTTEPEPEATPEPEPTPEVTPEPESAPAPAPIRERTRVRKD